MNASQIILSFKKNLNKQAKLIIGEPLTCQQACTNEYWSALFMTAN